MATKRRIDQHIAVFGSTGSGKSTLMASLFGAAQEQGFGAQHPYAIRVADRAQAAQLRDIFYGDRAGRERAADVTARSVAFDLHLRVESHAHGKNRSFLSRNRGPEYETEPAFTLHWHDLPGVWFAGADADNAQRQRRLEELRSVTKAPIALLALDGAKLQAQAAAGAYIREMLSNFAERLAALRDEMLVGGKELVEFPRVWVIAATKADLLPDLGAYGLRDLVHANAAAEVERLRDVLASYVVGDAALDIGEDFLILGARPDGAPGLAGVAGADGVPAQAGAQPRRSSDATLLVALAALLPLKRHIQWERNKQLPGKASGLLLRGAGTAALALVSGKLRLPQPFNMLVRLLGVAGVERLLKSAGNSLQDRSDSAKAREHAISETLLTMHDEITAAAGRGAFVDGSEVLDRISDPKHNRSKNKTLAVPSNALSKIGGVLQHADMQQVGAGVTKLLRSARNLKTRRKR